MQSDKRQLQKDRGQTWGSGSADEVLGAVTPQPDGRGAARARVRHMKVFPFL